MKLILHVGAGKTGSTAIQDFLRDNAAKLRSAGVLVPDMELGLDGRVVGAQIAFFNTLAKGPDSGRVVSDSLRSLRAYMKQHGLQTLVISAENLMYASVAPSVWSVALDLFDVQVVAYVRRQDDFILSSWHQWGLKAHESFDRYLAECVGRYGDWFRYLAPWEEAVGRERIFVRRFQKSALVDGDVVADFLSVTGLQIHGLQPRRSLANQSVDEHLGAMAHRARDLFPSPHNPGPYNDIEFAMGRKPVKAYRGSILLSFEARQSILAAYDESNRLLRERYFPDLPPAEPLFEPLRIEEVVTVTDAERLQCQQDILFRSIVGLSRRVRSLEGRLQRLSRGRKAKPRKRPPFLRGLIARIWGSRR